MIADVIKVVVIKDGADEFVLNVEGCTNIKSFSWKLSPFHFLEFLEKWLRHWVKPTFLAQASLWWRSCFLFFFTPCLVSTNPWDVKLLRSSFLCASCFFIEVLLVYQIISFKMINEWLQSLLFVYAHILLLPSSQRSPLSIISCEHYALHYMESY